MTHSGRFLKSAAVLVLGSGLLCSFAYAQDLSGDETEVVVPAPTVAPGIRKQPPPRRVKAPGAVPTQAAAASPTPDEMAKMPKSGVLASTIGGEFGASNANTWSDVDLSGESKPPLSASVARVGSAGQWKLRVFNNGKNAYSFTVKVVQLTRNSDTTKPGTPSRSDSFTFSLKPGESAERMVPGGSGAAGAKVVLESYRRLKMRATPTPSASPGGRRSGQRPARSMK